MAGSFLSTEYRRIFVSIAIMELVARQAVAAGI